MTAALHYHLTGAVEKSYETIFTSRSHQSIKQTTSLYCDCTVPYDADPYMSEGCKLSKSCVGSTDNKNSPQSDKMVHAFPLNP